MDRDVWGYNELRPKTKNKQTKEKKKNATGTEPGFTNKLVLILRIPKEIKQKTDSFFCQCLFNNPYSTCNLSLEPDSKDDCQRYRTTE